MRTIEEIKADIQRAGNAGHIVDAVRLNREYSEVLHEVEMWWAALPTERQQAICNAEREQRCVLLLVAFGETVYRLCKCEDIPSQLDGTMYGSDGGPGTATGYYCPYEHDCPHEADDVDFWDCGKAKDRMAIFEDCLSTVVISRDGDETMLCFENTPACDASDFGKTVFLTRAAADAALTCSHKAADGACNLCSDGEVRQPCVDGPCDAALAGQEEGRG